MGQRWIVCACLRRDYGASDCIWKKKIEYSHSHLAVLCYDAHSEIQSHIYQEQRVWKHVKSLPSQPAVAVQKRYLHGDPNQVQKCDSHHAHDVVTPTGSQNICVPQILLSM